VGEDGICNDVIIVLGAVAPTPMRAKRTEVVIKGKQVKSEVIQKAAETAAKEAQPISDVRCSANYSREMVNVLTRRALAQCFRHRIA